MTSKESLRRSFASEAESEVQVKKDRTDDGSDIGGKIFNLITFYTMWDLGW